jgi:hypothetical protein
MNSHFQLLARIIKREADVCNGLEQSWVMLPRRMTMVFEKRMYPDLEMNDAVVKYNIMEDD